MDDDTWTSADQEQDTTPGTVSPETPDPTETPGQQAKQPADTDRVTELEAELNTLKFENAYRDAFANSGLPAEADSVVRDILTGATTEQVAPTIGKLADFARLSQPASPPSQRPLDSMKPGSGPGPAGNGIHDWQDALRTRKA